VSACNVNATEIPARLACKLCISGLRKVPNEYTVMGTTQKSPTTAANTTHQP
jgi:hypothetical protein